MSTVEELEGEGGMVAKIIRAGKAPYVVAWNTP
jgi:hypothetical protein